MLITQKSVTQKSVMSIRFLLVILNMSSPIAY